MARHDRVYQVNKDGTAGMVDEVKRADDGDLGVVVGALVQMSMDVQTTFTAIPDRTDALFNVYRGGQRVGLRVPPRGRHPCAAVHRSAPTRIGGSHKEIRERVK